MKRKYNSEGSFKAECFDSSYCSVYSDVMDRENESLCLLGQGLSGEPGPKGQVRFLFLNNYFLYYFPPKHYYLELAFHNSLLLS